MIYLYYIYKIENLVNHKKYIGLTNNIKRRQLRHFTDLKRNKHDNSFLQKEYNIFGKDNFNFEKIFEGEVTYEEIGSLEKYYIQYYDSYKNGYNQNEGGNFGPSNGGTHLTEADILNILSALEFMSRPG
jgi:group I intron endonuclease